MQPVLGVSLLLHCNAHILLTKRGKPPAKGLWSLPGGKVEFGETAFQAVLREIKEETGLTLETALFHHITEIIQPEFHYIILVHEAEISELIPPVAGDDAMDAQWFSLQEMLILEKDNQITKGTFDKINAFLSQKTA